MEAVDTAQDYFLGPINPYFNPEHYIMDSLLGILPEDAHKIVSGKLHISLTRASTFKNEVIIIYIIFSNFNFTIFKILDIGSYSFK